MNQPANGHLNCKQRWREHWFLEVTKIRLESIKVRTWIPSRVSEAMATQPFPTIAHMAAPLYSVIDCRTTESTAGEAQEGNEK
jgi:hypothetical protein